MTTRRHTSARSDQPRSHRSQAKPAKAQPILLDRLDAALCRQNVVLKRNVLQLVAAEAFGFHNANEFAAADLVPPPAKVIGRVELDDDRGLIVVEDPSLHAIFGLDEGFFREALATSRGAQYGISPYGDLVDLSGLLADRRSGLPVAPTATTLSYTPDPFHLYAGETIHFARIEIDPARPVLFVELTRTALDETIAGWCRENWVSGANRKVDPATLKNANTVLLAYFAGDLADRLIYAETKLPTPPQHVGGATLTVWTAHHGDAHSHRIYVDTTEIGLHRQIRSLLEGLWEDIEGEAGEFDNTAETHDLIALYERHSTMTISIEHASITLPAGSVPGPPAPTPTRAAATSPDDDRLRDWMEAVTGGQTRLGYDAWLRGSRVQPEIERDISRDRSEPEAEWPWLGASGHPEYIRSDWRADCLRDPRTPNYTSWVDGHVSDNTSQYWISAFDHEVLFTGDRTCVAHFHHAMRQKDGIEGRDISVITPGDILTICDIGFVNGHVVIRLTTQDGTSLTLDSRERSGLLRLIKFEAGRIPIDVARHYPESDWAAEMTATGRGLSYATWAASRWASRCAAQENWMTPSRLSRNPASRALTTHVYSQAVNPSVPGPKGQSLCRPGDRIHILNISHGIDGASVKVMTDAEGEFTLHEKDRGGLFPISTKAVAATEETGISYHYGQWLSAVSGILVTDVDPDGYRDYYATGLSPLEASATARLTLEAKDCSGDESIAESIP